MKRTLLEMVQSILNDMDSEEVNSISDSDEARQVASVVEDTFYNIIGYRDKEEHWELSKLISLSDSARPTYFRYGASDVDDVRALRVVRYNVSDTSGSTEFREICYITPLDFLDRMPYNTTNTVSMYDPNGGTTVFCNNDKAPSFYTSFDNEHIVMDAFNATVEDTLQASKTQALVYRTPTFTIEDSFVPDLVEAKFPLLLAEAKSTCMSLWRDGSDPKVEQAGRRLKVSMQNEEYRTQTTPKRPLYGRR